MAEPVDASVDAVVEAIRTGALAVVPTDTVYGLAANPDLERAVEQLYRAKSRDAAQPTALVVAEVDLLLERLPALRGRTEAIVRALLPGPYTLVLPNPERRYRPLTGTTPDALGVRVPAFSGPGRQVLERVGAYAASSANARGGRDPRRLADVPAEIRALAAAVLDAGELPGTPSTVLDVSGDVPRVLREGAAPSADALRRVGAVL